MIPNYIESMSFPDRLREIMEAKKVEQTTLGRAMGVTSQAVSQWVNGPTQPRSVRLVKIAEALKVTPAELLAPVGTPFNTEPVGFAKPVLHPKDGGDLPDTPSEVLLMRLWGHMGQDMQNAILDLALAYARATGKGGDDGGDDGGH